MTRELLAGGVLNEIAGSLDRYPDWRVYVWNPNLVTIGELVAGETAVTPLDLTPFVESFSLEHNSGFENGDDPSFPIASLTFRRNPDAGIFRRGWIEDGVIIRIYQGDRRVRVSDWPAIFTGTFRGRPGDDPGTPSGLSEGFTAEAYGREERYLNLTITTDDFAAGTDVGTAIVAIAQQHMGLTQNEIRIGDQGYPMRHISNQVVETNALEALWNLLFPVGKKPRFDGAGRLVAIDVNLDKPATRIYRTNSLVAQLIASPNDVEVNNRVVVRGLDSTMTKIVQELQRLQTYDVTVGFFKSSLSKSLYYSEDRKRRAEDTYVVTIDKIKWSDAEWTPVDEFHGVLGLDTKFLRNARAIIFASYLAIQVTIAIIDLYFQGEGAATIVTTILGIEVTLAALRFALQLASQAALAALLWAMQFIGHGIYEVHGRPFEYVYQQLLAEAVLIGLEPSEVRTQSFRNDLLTKMDDIEAVAKERLRRELIKNQVFQIVILDDLALEIDDVVELADGARYYIVSTAKECRVGAPPVLTLTAWKIESDPLAGATAAE